MDEITNPLTDETDFLSDDPWAQELDRRAGNITLARTLEEVA